MTTCPSKCSARIPESSLIALIISYCTSKLSGNHAVPTSTVPRIWPFLTPSTAATLIWTIILLTCRFSPHSRQTDPFRPEVRSHHSSTQHPARACHLTASRCESHSGGLQSPKQPGLHPLCPRHSSATVPSWYPSNTSVHLNPQGLCSSVPCACSALLPESHGVKFLSALLKCQALKTHPI